MTEIRFYHLQSQTLAQALPALLTKAYEGGHRIWVRTSDKGMAESISETLWSKNPNSFIPHGTEKDGEAAHQPIWISNGESNDNDAKTLILTQGVTMEPEDLKAFDLCCEMLDGRDDEAVTAARERWKTYKDADFDVTYWQQSDNGGWDKKA